MEENDELALVDMVQHDPKYRTDRPVYRHEDNGFVEEPPNGWELKACSKCSQMTQHIKGECLKCKAKKEME